MILYLVPYAAVLVFVVAVVARLVRLYSLPVHLRWELYPVAHEKNAAYGGSFFEHVDWWKQPRESSVAGELKVMVPEILLLKGVYEHNRSLWTRSFPFHFGLYLCAVFIVLLLASGIAQAAGTAVAETAAGLGAALYWLTLVVGVAALALVALGAFLLLLRRLGDPALREYSSSADILNLVFFLATAAVGLLAVGLSDPGFAQLRGFVQRTITLDFAGEVPPLVAATVVMASALLAYIPITHMAHFFTKWFMYHDIRWEDTPNLVGSKLERRIQAQLGYKVDWAAEHIRGGGTKTWVDVATEEVAPEAPKKPAAVAKEAK